MSVFYWTLGETALEPSPHLLLLLLAAMISENYALSLPAFNVSLAFPLIVATLIIAGPAGGALVAAVCFTNLKELREGREWPPLLFNFGQLILAATAGGIAYTATGARTLAQTGSLRPMVAEELPVIIAAALVAAGVVYVVNITLTSYAVSALRGTSPVNVARFMLAYLPTQLALAFVGILIAQVLAVQIVALPLFLFPLVLARQVYQRYESMRDAYLDTVRSLVGALEAKDPYTRGHSERVAKYSLRVGRAMHIDERTLERLEPAALLHDIGKLTLSKRVLTKPGPLAPDEQQEMRRHPVVGAEMIARIPPLRSIAPYVGMHHERIDGAGYPRGCADDQIPLVPRILAVVDAYDAMTTERAYRPAMAHENAVLELVAGAGTQFDSAVVEGFVSSGIQTVPEGQAIGIGTSLVGEVRGERA